MIRVTQFVLPLQLMTATQLHILPVHVIHLELMSDMTDISIHLCVSGKNYLAEKHSTYNCRRRNIFQNVELRLLRLDVFLSIYPSLVSFVTRLIRSVN